MCGLVIKRHHIHHQLHPDRKLQLENIKKEKQRKKEELLQEKEDKDYSKDTFDRYSY